MAREGPIAHFIGGTRPGPPIQKNISGCAAPAEFPPSVCVDNSRRICYNTPYSDEKDQYPSYPSQREPPVWWKGEGGGRRIPLGAGARTEGVLPSRRAPGAPVTARECVGTPRGRFREKAANQRWYRECFRPLSPPGRGVFSFPPGNLNKRRMGICRFMKN